MKVLFVMLNDRKRTLIPPSLAVLIAVLKTNGIETKLFDISFYAENERVGDEDSKEDAGIFQEIDYSTIGIKKKYGLEPDFLECIRSFQPELVAFSINSFTYEIALKFSKLLKNNFGNKIKTILGGIHVTLDYMNITDESIDFMCIGEGELALLELCQKMELGEPLTNIKNIWYRTNGKMIKTGLREPIEMNKLPLPDWEEFATYHQYGPWRGKLVKMALAEFSRVCPFSCTYCGNRIMIDTYAQNGIKLRTRHKSPQKFIEELKFLKEKYQLEMIAILDGTFLAFPDDCLEELSRLYKKEIDLPFYITTTASSITKKRAELLKYMGCVCINLGVENGDSEYRKKYMNRPWSYELIINAFRIVKEVGIEARAYNIIGAPFETRETIMKTIELNRTIQADSSSLAIYIPFPGSELRNLCVEQGLFKEGQKIRGDGTIPNIKSATLTDDEIIGLFKTFTLYLKVPKELFPVVKLTEENSEFSERLRKIMMELYPNIKQKTT